MGEVVVVKIGPFIQREKAVPEFLSAIFCNPQIRRVEAAMAPKELCE